MMKKALLWTILALTSLGFSRQIPPILNPAVELYQEYLTCYLNFENHNPNPAVGMSHNTTPSSQQLYGKGFFGEALAAGHVHFQAKNLIDTSIPGTMIFWIMAPEIPRKTRYEPGQTFFVLNYPERNHRLLAFRQSYLPWGTAVIAMRAELPQKTAKGIKVFAASMKDSLTHWKAGEWRMIAVTWEPDKVGISINGSPLKEFSLDRPPGKSDRNSSIGFSAGNFPGKGFRYSLDECVIMNKKLTSEQIKEIYRLSVKKKKITDSLPN